MNPSRIVILPNTSEFIPSDQETVYISRKDLGEWAKTGKIFSHLFCYKECRLRVFFADRVPNPLFIICLARLLSKGTCVIEDQLGNKETIPFTGIFKQSLRFIREYLKRNSYYLRKKLEVESWLERPPYTPSSPLNLNHPPIYLRTDHSFGLSSGGSVGHTLGVANNLEAFTQKPYMASTVFFPMLNDRIHKLQLKPSSRFLNFQELLFLQDNETVPQQVDPFIKGKDLSFVYHRSSLHNYCGVIVAQKYNIPLVLEFNGSEVWANRHWRSALTYETLGTQIEDINFKHANLIIVVSENLKNELIDRGVAPEKILVNPNGVDPDVYYPELDGAPIRERYRLEDKIVIGFIGTFGKWHGAEVLAKAFGILLNRYPDIKGKVKLLMVGDGLNMGLVKNEISKAGVDSECILTGLVHQQDGPIHLAACDIFASPHVPNADGSPFFGSPTKLFEYMAMGRGIVASDLDQIGTILNHKKTAWMVPPGDANSLAEGLKTLIDQPDLRHSMGRSAREEVVAKYSWREHTRKIIDALKERFPCA